MLLGSQRFSPTLQSATAALGVAGPFATITCGWQEREPDDRDLDEHLGGNTVNLLLHRRAEDALRNDKELLAAHRLKQDTLRLKQDFYRVRLELELEANHIIGQRKAPADILAEEQAASLASIRQLDEYHLGQCGLISDRFDAEWRPWERPSVARHREEIAKALEGVTALAIAGGHVATLLNRMRLFGIPQLLREDQHIFAWAAGAMAISDRVVLFHDSPPQGVGVSEVLDRGLGLVPGVVPLPHPEDRLKLDDVERVSVMARRFGPARCVALPAGSRVTTRNGVMSDPDGAVLLCDDGRCVPLTPDATTPVTAHTS